MDPVAAPVVQQIFQWAYEKVGLNRIVLMLNEGGYPAPSNYKYSTGEITHENLIGEGFWQTRTVMKILKEEKYTGDMVQGHTKTVAHKQRPAGKENLISVAATHEAIVSGIQQGGGTMKKYVIALYIRLSLEDFKTDSLSISSQRMILQEHAAGLEEYGNAELMEFVDNGYSGANFERPAVQELLDLVRANRIDCIMVKDFSRFGRNSLETGYFIERVFPIFHTRFISVSDDFDTKKLKGDTGGMEVAFKYLISEYYSRDMSVKTKTAKYMKMRRGEYQSKICPYGYCKGDNNRMVPDPETSCVIQMIFEYAASGMNSAQIARELHSQAIPTPGEYKALKGQKYHDVSRTNGVWSNSTILRLLADERYIGTYVIGKKTVTEIGGNRMRTKDESEWIKIPNHHTPLVSKELFEKANASIKRFKIPKRKQHSYPLRGKVFCGSCKHAMHRSNETIYRCRFSYM